MELKEFIRGTLEAIIGAIEEAQAGPHGLHVSPAIQGAERTSDGLKTRSGLLAYPIRFDIAVTAGDQASGKAGAGIQVFAIRAGADAEVLTRNESVSRVKFEIPITLPEFQAGP